MTQKELFSQFLKITVPSPLDLSREKDIVVGDFIIARLNSDGCCIHYLKKGDKLEIPKEWLDLFSSFNVHSGAQCIHLKDKGGDAIDKVIYYMLLTITYLDLERKDGLLNLLGQIGEIGTGDFRAWVKEEFDIELKPFLYTSLYKIIEI